MSRLSFSILVLAIMTTAGCSKKTPENLNEILPLGTVIASGSFVSSRHTTSGTVKVVMDASNKKKLVFENFQSDNGPDLRVWLSVNQNGSSYQEIGLLKAATGNFFYEMNADINYTLNNHVLIWCKDFSVLFGYAVLQ